MKCTKFKYSLLLIILMAMVFTSACKTKSDGEFDPKLYYTITADVVTVAPTNTPTFRQLDVKPSADNFKETLDTL